MEREGGGWKVNKINSEYKMIEKCGSILDLCAAPGEWLHFASQKAPNPCFILGVDILPILINNNNNNNNIIVALQHDITSPLCSDAIKRVMEEHGCAGFDLVLHNALSDMHARDPNELPLKSLELATQFLAPNGTFVTKADGKHRYFQVVFCIARLFESIELVRFDDEFYLVGFNYKAPSFIDPHIFDVDQLLRRCQYPPPRTRFDREKHRRSSYLRYHGVKGCFASKFVLSDNPLMMLRSSSHIAFEGANYIKDHELTTDEVRFACSNIRDKSKPEMKLLIKWHAAIRVALTKSEPASPSTKVEPESKERQVVKRLTETVESMYDMCHKKSGAKKLIVEQQSKGRKDSVDVAVIDKDFKGKLKRSHEHLEDLVDQAYEILNEKRYVSRKRKVKHPKGERCKVTFDDDVYSDHVTTVKLFRRCIFDNNVDEVENKKSDSEEKVEKGKSAATV